MYVYNGGEYYRPVGQDNMYECNYCFDKAIREKEKEKEREREREREREKEREKEKEKEKERRGEAPPQAGGARKEECSRPPLPDHPTVVHKVLRRGSCSGDQSGAGLSQREAAIQSLRRKPKRNRQRWLLRPH